MRLALSLLCLMSTGGAAAAQSLDGSFNSSLNSGLASGLNSTIASGFNSTIGPPSGTTRASTGRSTAVTALGSCAPTQFDLNHTGCRPMRELGIDTGSSYDMSVRAMGPLQGLTLDGLTLEFPNGPAGPD